ncbi:MAG TPA: aminodeoxychorismate lyase [Actinomycetales bacterium]
MTTARLLLMDDAGAFADADPAAAHLTVTDLGVVRGDGCFETISVRGGRPQALEAHLTRFARSARMLELPEPVADHWRAGVLQAAASSDPGAELALRTVLTRGREGSGIPTGWIHVTAAADYSAVRRDGVDAVLLDRGYRHDVGQTSPWLLQGAKTLSYAVNMAALREAERRGAGDVVFVSSDGFVLEGPTSTVVVHDGSGVRTPPVEHAILPGTTQDAMFRWCEQRGLPVSHTALRPDDLLAASTVWLLSSVRQAVAVRSLDGEPLHPDAALTADLNKHLLGRRE